MCSIRDCLPEQAVHKLRSRWPILCSEIVYGFESFLNGTSVFIVFWYVSIDREISISSSVGMQLNMMLTPFSENFLELLIPHKGSAASATGCNLCFVQYTQRCTQQSVHSSLGMYVRTYVCTATSPK